MHGESQKLVNEEFLFFLFVVNSWQQKYHEFCLKVDVSVYLKQPTWSVAQEM